MRTKSLFVSPGGRAARWIVVLLSAAWIAAFVAGTPAAFADEKMAGFETKARQAIALVHGTGEVLYSKNAEDAFPPASFVKLMVAYRVFERLEAGVLSLDDTLLVSERAWREGGSKMFVSVGAEVPVEDLVRGLIIAMANDAAIAIAEGLAGSEEAFVAEMTATARELRLDNTHFTNATGAPDQAQVTTARDMALLAVRLIDDFPQYYGLFAETSFTHNEIKQGSRNPLLYRDVGADGLMTARPDAGYALVASAERGGRRLIIVVSGLETVLQRSREAERLLDRAFRAAGS